MEIMNPKIIKEKNPIGRQPTFTHEYMEMVARKVVDEGMTYREASKTFGTSHGSICAWVKNYKKHGKSRQIKKPLLPNLELQNLRLEQQVRDLKGEIGDLYLETQFLKKALKTFQQKKNENSSLITSSSVEASKALVEDAK